MFGYIEPKIPMLRVQEFEMYKSVYCGLCRTLARHYGPIARFTLSYDFTFVTMLTMAVNGTQPMITPKRCPYNPLKHKPHLQGCDELKSCCDMAMIMLHFKCKDNQHDNHFPKSVAWQGLGFATSSVANSAGLSIGEGFTIVEKAMKAQWELEQAPTSLDHAADPTATALAGLFELLCKKKEAKPIMYRLGYMLGRFVYICDAIDDMEKDQKAHRFNPLLAECDPEYLEETMMLTISQITLAYQLLDILYFKEILDNIIYLGLADKAKKLISGAITVKPSVLGGLENERPL